jgi:hypothetical protein
MSGPHFDPPERLLASDATDFERRVLETARENRPSPASSARMARALGLTAAAVGTAVAAEAVAAEAAATKATIAAGTSTIWPWISAGVLGLVVAGAVVGTRGRHAPEPKTAPPAVTAPVARPPSAVDEPADVVVAPAPRVAASSPRVRAAAGGDLAEQVAFIDSARTAMSGGADRRALEILRRYLDKYPAGSFRPEAIALKIEALMKLGRESEARALAERFVAEHRGSLLARRVADVVGLSKP